MDSHTHVRPGSERNLERLHARTAGLGLGVQIDFDLTDRKKTDVLR